MTGINFATTNCIFEIIPSFCDHAIEHKCWVSIAKEMLKNVLSAEDWDIFCSTSKLCDVWSVMKKSNFTNVAFELTLLATSSMFSIASFWLAIFFRVSLAI